MAFREFIRAADEAVDRLGQIEFHRTPHRPVVVRPQELDPLGPIPARPDNRRFQIFSIVAPLAAGLILYAFTRQLHFLAIILISPLAMIGNWFEDRRSGKRRYRDQLATFRERLAEHRARADEALDEERVARLRSAPDLADLARRAELRTIDLWPRDRRSEDFGTVRIGLGDTTSLVSAPLATGGDDDLREEAEEALRGVDQMRSVPVTVSLKEAGVLAVGDVVEPARENGGAGGRQAHLALPLLVHRTLLRGTEQDIQQFCQTTYGVQFPMFEKLVVTGDDASPFYQALAAQAGGEQPGWNFHKYLLDRDGRVIGSFGSRVTPEDPKLLAAIEQALSEPAAADGAVAGGD